MRIKKQILKTLIIVFLSFLFNDVKAGESDSTLYTKTKFSQRYIQRIEIEGRPTYIFPTNSFLRGENAQNRYIETAFSTHVKYSFQSRPNTNLFKLYNGVYQGLGIGYYDFVDKREIGKPVAIYLFQGGRLASLARGICLNYEWNFGLSFGWKPYDYYRNYYNKMIGSRLNAYINTNFYINWQLSRRFDMTTGFALTHFSNGNTKFPNAGLNTVSFKLGLIYKFTTKEDISKISADYSICPFSKHISYDLVVFSSWRRKGVTINDEPTILPKAYPVVGFNFSPMYNLGYKFRVGLSLDGVYDSSANLYKDDSYYSSYDSGFKRPSVNRQLSLGISGRTEYVMPFFTINLGLGFDVVNWKDDLKGFYQILALKVELSRNSFLHIGYNLKDFHDPNFLMLGIGFRFNNKYPKH